MRGKKKDAYLNNSDRVWSDVPQQALLHRRHLHLPPDPPAAAAHCRFPDSPTTLAATSSSSSTRKNKRLWSSHAFRGQVLSHRHLFDSIHDLGLVRNHSKVLCVSTKTGNEVGALFESGVANTTRVELIDSPPLVNRVDMHNLPFFDGVFDLAFSEHSEEALFISRVMAEMERMVRVGRGLCGSR
ncbi:hypothetical protein NL676_025612 [Syzygium grande]|nr:hypothetical protein NL676_025612 [Syzygium grande]